MRELINEANAIVSIYLQCQEELFSYETGHSMPASQPELHATS